MAGVVAVSYERSEGRWFRVGIGWAFLNVALSSVSGYMRKRGMNVLPEAALLAAWGSIVAFVTCELIRHRVPREMYAMGPRRILPLLALGAGLNSLHQLGTNLAVAGQLSLAVPLLNSAPVFALILTAVFLRDLERIRARVVFGVLIAVAGIVSVGLGRHG